MDDTTQPVVNPGQPTGMPGVSVPPVEPPVQEPTGMPGVSVPPVGTTVPPAPITPVEPETPTPTPTPAPTEPVV
jgi:hypothetical protein